MKQWSLLGVTLPGLRDMQIAGKAVHPGVSVRVFLGETGF